MSFIRGKYCPQCGSSEIYPSKRRTLSDKLLRFIAIRPYRCHDCNSRHHGFRGKKRTGRHDASV